MALLSQQLQRFFLTTLNSASNFNLKATKRNNSGIALKERARCCSAIAIDAPSTLSDVGGIRWGLSRLQGPREEMEDDAVIRSEGLDGFSFAAVFDGHAGFSSVKFLRWVSHQHRVLVFMSRSSLLLAFFQSTVVHDVKFWLCGCSV